MPGKWPFELSREELEQHLEQMVDATFSAIVSEFLLMPAGNAFIKYPELRDAYEVLKRQTNAFEDFAAPAVRHTLIDGRGFRQRREDLRQLLLRLDGKVFTAATLEHLISHTRIREFVTQHES